MRTRRAAATRGAGLRIAGLLITFAAVPHAWAAEDSGFYLDASAVRAVRTLDRSGLDAALTNAVSSQAGGTLALDGSTVQRDAATWTAGVGYRASTYFAVEVSYLDLGHLWYTGSGIETFPAGPISLTTVLDVTSKGPALDVVGILPLLEGLEVGVRAGAFEGKTTTDFSNTTSNGVVAGSMSKTTTSLLVGVGASYAFSGHWAAQIQLLHLNGLQECFLDHKFNVDIATLGLTYMF
jgi:opacity protein-like surface antigen